MSTVQIARTRSASPRGCPSKLARDSTAERSPRARSRSRGRGGRERKDDGVEDVPPSWNSCESVAPWLEFFVEQLEGFLLAPLHYQNDRIDEVFADFERFAERERSYASLKDIEWTTRVASHLKKLKRIRRTNRASILCDLGDNKGPVDSIMLSTSFVVAARKDITIRCYGLDDAFTKGLIKQAQIPPDFPFSDDPRVNVELLIMLKLYHALLRGGVVGLAKASRDIGVTPEDLWIKFEPLRFLVI